MLKPLWRRHDELSATAKLIWTPGTVAHRRATNFNPGAYNRGTPCELLYTVSHRHTQNRLCHATPTAAEQMLQSNQHSASQNQQRSCNSTHAWKRTVASRHQFSWPAAPGNQQCLMISSSGQLLQLSSTPTPFVPHAVVKQSRLPSSQATQTTEASTYTTTPTESAQDGHQKKPTPLTNCHDVEKTHPSQHNPNPQQPWDQQHSTCNRHRHASADQHSSVLCQTLEHTLTCTTDVTPVSYQFEATGERRPLCPTSRSKPASSAVHTAVPAVLTATHPKCPMHVPAVGWHQLLLLHPALPLLPSA